MMREVSRMGRAVLVMAVLAAAGCGQGRREAQAGGGTSDIEQYIAHGWDALRRSPLNCGALVDSKVGKDKSVLWVAADQEVTAQMRAATSACGVAIEKLPAGLRVGNGEIVGLDRQGLLYVPHDYVVPGGRFNEMYGWDSFFILEGLIESAKRGESGRAELARGMTENFFYELDHYGAVLNANRTYYLTRSQPPFLTSMVLAVEGQLPEGDRRAWLERGYRAAGQDWAYWDRPEMRAGETGLSRYWDYGKGPVPEMQDDSTYYQNVIGKLLEMGAAGRAFLRPVMVGEGNVPRVAVGGGAEMTLTEDFYKGDRAMRASGFDVSFRFGPYGGATHHFAAVCLNSLLYKEEMDLAGMAQRLGKRAEAGTWRGRAAARRAAMDRYLWDAEARTYFDYDFVAGKRSTYLYATMVCPLWAGAATKEQARGVVGRLKELEKPGGVAMSTQQTGVQWDLPFGWAPLQLLAVEGLQRYGYAAEARGIAGKWLRMIVENFRREGTLHEKYDVVTRSSDVKVEVGYSANVVGFGWTNGVFLKLLDGLPGAERERVTRP
jgi:alpha,alpha-trehalase